ncbi:hypothetical protein E4T42_02758 [Aureobasidium subglaciale]|nr:hypothetical protein E4T42_02758 [Aureobasidium subglaciale]
MNFEQYVSCRTANSPDREGRDLLEHNKRLKQELRESKEECARHVNDYNTLVDEYNEMPGIQNAKLRTKINKIKQLREESESLVLEIEDLEKHQEQQGNKIKKDTKLIRKLLEDRDDLQERLAKETEKTQRAHVNLDFKVKQSIATSTRLDKQLGDETFRKAMDQIYEKFRDCFLVVRRRQEFDIRTRPRNESLEKFLSKHVPSWRENNADVRLHVCISFVSRVLTQFVNSKFVFGMPNEDLINATWRAWTALAEGPQTSRSQRDVKRWMVMTSTVLTNNHQELMLQARQDSLNFMLDTMKQDLEAATTMDFTDAIRRRLSDAISPHLTTLRLLHFQEWKYKFNMVTASRKGEPVRFSRARMDGMFWEESGYVQASLFPQLCRLEEDEEDEGETYTVVCKARVAVVATVEAAMDEKVGGDDEEMEGTADSGGVNNTEPRAGLSRALGDDTMKAEDKNGEEPKRSTVSGSFEKEDDEMDERA